MKLTIFGATGKVGQHLVKQSLQEGHNVCAFTRSPGKLTQPDKNLTVIQGDALDAKAVTPAISGSDAVLIALGMPLRDTSGLRAKGTSVIVQAMQAEGIKRLICLSGLGAHESHALLPPMYKYLLVPLLMRRLYADHQMQEAAVTASNLDWTIVRPAAFDAKGRLTGEYWHGFQPQGRKLKIKISTADVADFMLKQLVSDHYLRKAPCLSY